MFTIFLKIALPAIATNLLGLASIVTNSVFAGQMNDPVKLAVVGLTSFCCHVMVFSFMIGLNSAQETLTSQAYGAQNLHLCGVYLNRGIFILITFFVPFALVPCFFGESILLALGQNAEVSRLCQVQIRSMIPSILFLS